MNDFPKCELVSAEHADGYRVEQWSLPEMSIVAIPVNHDAFIRRRRPIWIVALIYALIFLATIGGAIGFIAWTRSDPKLPQIEVDDSIFEPWMWSS